MLRAHAARAACSALRGAGEHGAGQLLLAKTCQPARGGAGGSGQCKAWPKWAQAATKGQPQRRSGAKRSDRQGCPAVAAQQGRIVARARGGRAIARPWGGPGVSRDMKTRKQISQDTTRSRKSSTGTPDTATTKPIWQSRWKNSTYFTNRHTIC